MIINIAVEDKLSEAVFRSLIEKYRTDLSIKTCYCQGGSGYLKKKIRAFNQAARVIPFFVLTDLDRTVCPPELIHKWLVYEKHPHLLLRVAVKEVESWLLADRENLSRFLSVSTARVPLDAEKIENPKEFLISLAHHSRKRTIRDGIVPRHGSTAFYGPDYNNLLINFVVKDWDIETASGNSDSLARAITAIKSFPEKGRL